MNVDKIKHHIEALQDKHRTLDEQIDKMESTGMYEDEELHRLKKKRLFIRDEITEFQNKIEASL